MEMEVNGYEIGSRQNFHRPTSKEWTLGVLQLNK